MPPLLWLIYAIVWGGSITGPLLALDLAITDRSILATTETDDTASRGSIGSSVLHQLG